MAVAGTLSYFLGKFAHQNNPFFLVKLHEEKIISFNKNSKVYFFFINLFLEPFTLFEFSRESACLTIPNASG